MKIPIVKKLNEESYELWSHDQKELILSGTLKECDDKFMEIFQKEAEENPEEFMEIIKNFLNKYLPKNYKK